jgi:hypothetical protein
VVSATRVVFWKSVQIFMPRMAARCVADAERKTGVLPIFEFSTDLCDQFAKNRIFVVGGFWMGFFFFFEMWKRNNRVAR